MGSRKKFAVILFCLVFQVRLRVFYLEFLVNVLVTESNLAVLSGLPTHFVYLFSVDHIWGYSNKVLFWSPSRDWSGVCCQDRVVLSSRSAHPYPWSVYSCATALPSSRVTRSSQPVLLLTSITAHEHLSCIVVKVEAIKGICHQLNLTLISLFIHICVKYVLMSIIAN